MDSAMHRAAHSADFLLEEKTNSTKEELWMRGLKLVELVSGSFFNNNTDI